MNIKQNQQDVPKGKKRRMTRRARRLYREQVLKYLDAGFCITSACQLAYVSRRTFYDWCNSDPEFLEQVEHALGQANAHAEAAIMKAIQSNDVKAAQWWLERRSPDYRIQRGPETEYDDYELQINTLSHSDAKTDSSSS